MVFAPFRSPLPLVVLPARTLKDRTLKKEKA